jgi:hypothetical protein
MLENEKLRQEVVYWGEQKRGILLRHDNYGRPS